MDSKESHSILEVGSLIPLNSIASCEAQGVRTLRGFPVDPLKTIAFYKEYLGIPRDFNSF